MSGNRSCNYDLFIYLFYNFPKEKTKNQSNERAISANLWSGNMRAIRSSALGLGHHSRCIKAVPKWVIAELSQQQDELSYISTWRRWRWASKIRPEDAQQMHTHGWDAGRAWEPEAENAVRHVVSWSWRSLNIIGSKYFKTTLFLRRSNAWWKVPTFCQSM